MVKITSVVAFLAAASTLVGAAPADYLETRDVVDSGSIFQVLSDAVAAITKGLSVVAIKTNPTAAAAAGIVAPPGVVISSGPTVPFNGTATVLSTCTNQGQVAISFDDGMDQFEAQIAAEMQGTKTTFFINGFNFGCIYDKAEVLQELFKAGHTIGSHTWDHPDLNNITEQQINDELQKVEDAFIKILGVRPRYFRPPFGNLPELAIKVLSQRGYTRIWLWDSDTNDASGGTFEFAKGIYDGVAKSFPAPHIVLDHSVINMTATQIIPYGVPLLINAGYKLVTLDQCINDPREMVYTTVGGLGVRDATWKC